MNKERLETFISSASLLSLLAIALGSFSRRTRSEIKVRDNFTCQMCGSKDRFRLEAAHTSHKRNQRYDKPENGRTLCACCHARDHILRRDDPSLGITKSENNGALNLIWVRLTDQEKAQLLSEFPVLITIIKEYQLQMFASV